MSTKQQPTFLKQITIIVIYNGVAGDKIGCNISIWFLTLK